MRGPAAQGRIAFKTFCISTFQPLNPLPHKHAKPGALVADCGSSRTQTETFIDVRLLWTIPRGMAQCMSCGFALEAQDEKRFQ